MKTLIFNRTCTAFETNHLDRIVGWRKENTIKLTGLKSKNQDYAIGCTLVEEDVDRIENWAKNVGLLNNK